MPLAKISKKIFEIFATHQKLIVIWMQIVLQSGQFEIRQMSEESEKKNYIG